MHERQQFLATFFHIVTDNGVIHVIDKVVPPSN